MGLIKALTSSVSSGIGDQFKEYVTCPSTEKTVLVCRGEVNHGKGNKKPSEGILSKGTAIVVPQGMAMMIIDNGAIVEFSAEAGTFTYDNSTEPSIFAGDFGKNLMDSIKTIGKRITFGGQTAKDQRVYYINTKIIPGNKFGSPQPKKITDEKYGILEITFNGEYAFKVVDPARLFTEVIGSNAADVVKAEEVLDSQMKGKFIEHLTRALTSVMRVKKVSFGDIGLYGTDLSDEMNSTLDETWREHYGLEITDVALRDINLTDASMARVNKIDDAGIFSDGKMQSGLMASASADAIKTAAGNESGAMMGFMGMGMAQNAGATMMGVANANAQAQASQTGSKFCGDCGTPSTGGNFCTNCGKKLN